MNGKTPRHFVALAIVAGLLASCGGAGGAGSSAAGTAADGGGGGGNASDMCSLLTTSEVQTATGIAVTSSGHGTLDAAHYCEWKLEPGTNVEGVAFDRLVAITKYAGATSYDLAAAAGSPVPGIGEKAVIVDHVVNVLMAGTHFAVVVVLNQPGDEDQTLLSKEDQVSQELAEKAADRL